MIKLRNIREMGQVSLMGDEKCIAKPEEHLRGQHKSGS
jgi:hypothetical protein